MKNSVGLITVVAVALNAMGELSRTANLRLTSGQSAVEMPVSGYLCLSPFD